MQKLVLLIIVLAVSSVNASETEISLISTNLTRITQSTDDMFDTPPNQAGFPIATGGSTSESCPQIVDIDDDGDLEILIGSGTSFHVYNHNGSMVSGFPVALGCPAYYTAAVGDIDNDGEMEIAIVTFTDRMVRLRPDGLNILETMTAQPALPRWQI
ncbi:MAG: VCBS repeat-containing protein [Candidatus Sabulitectum sp.]|nr:VCBS repeat-containing protein [Candidatus Sabulitectum sp.]